MSSQPDFTVIIPHRKEESIDRAVENLRSCDYDLNRLELLTVSGNQPSVQRNECIKRANGRFIYFIDNDSEMLAHNLSRALKLFQESANTAVVGGPNIAREGDTPLQKEFSHCLSSRFGVGPVASRYKPTGSIREATDRQLILCNLFIRKSVLNETGLFNEKLYPNEENDLMNRIESAGYKLMYDPEIQVLRSPRPDFKSFVKMLTGYGTGRFKQTLTDFRFMNLIFFLPACFVIYLLSLPFAAGALYYYLSPEAVLPALSALFLPVAVYLLLILAATAMSLVTFKHRRALSVLTFPVLFFSIHFFYGLGELTGIYRALTEKEKQVWFEVKQADLL